MPMSYAQGFRMEALAEDAYYQPSGSETTMSERMA